MDNINKIKLLSKEDLERQLNFRFDGKTALVTYHPVTLESNTSKEQFRTLLSALDNFNNLKVIFTKPNADTDGRVISNLIDEYVQEKPEKSLSFTSLGQLKYLSLLKHVYLVIGNSSSGIIEVPSFGKPTVNIGDRQQGRMRGESVIDCGCREEEIRSAIEKALSHSFQLFCETVKNPYGDGNASERIIKILKEKILEPISLKKKFFDVNVEMEDRQSVHSDTFATNQVICN